MKKFIRPDNVWVSGIKKQRILFVISHPDDECMFFGPLIYRLLQQNNQLYLLCLSFGNNEGKAYLRRHELWRSCGILGIEQSNITMVNSSHLPDDPTVEWKIEAVANFILNTVVTLDIETIVTFDRDGVSQHPNHSALYYAVSSLYLTNLLPKDCRLLTLDSINFIRKYLSLLDLVCTYFMAQYWCTLNFKEAAIIRSAMKEHKSQMKWFRWIYIYFSRYMFINSVKEIDLRAIKRELKSNNELK